MNDGRHEALNVAAVEDGFFLLGRMLVRVHRKDVGDARQIFRPLIHRDRRQLEGLCFMRSDVFRCRCEIRRGFQSGFLHRQAIIVFVGARLRIRQQDDIVGVGDRGVFSRRAAHVDHVSRTDCQLIRFNDRYVLERACLAVADEADRFERAGKIRTVHPITRFDNIEDAEDAARFARVGQFDFDPFEKRFLFELRDQVCAIDDQSIVHDRSPRSEADIVHWDELEI